MTYKATMTTKGQLTIPIALRKKLGLRRGSQVVFEEKNDTVVIESQESVLNNLYGSFKVPNDLKKIPLETVIKEARQKHYEKKFGKEK